MSSFAVQGNKRHGKNVLSTVFGIWCARRLGNIPLWANYKIYGYPNFHYFQHPKELQDLENAVLLYDELGTTGDARTWGSKEQILLTHLFGQMEKRGITLIYTSQRDYLIEKRIRMQTDYVIECYKHPLTHVMTQTWYDTTRGADHKVKIGRFRVDHPEYAYQHYNTFERVKSNVNFDDIIGKK